MSQYKKEELNLVLQAVLPLFIVAGLAIFLLSNSGGFPWFMLFGLSFGLSVIIFTWLGKKSSVFVASIWIGALVFSSLSI